MDALTEGMDRQLWVIPAMESARTLTTRLSIVMALLHAEWCRKVLPKDTTDREKIRG